MRPVDFGREAAIEERYYCSRLYMAAEAAEVSGQYDPAHRKNSPMLLLTYGEKSSSGLSMLLIVFYFFNE